MVVLNTATWIRIAATISEKRRCTSTALPSWNEVILSAGHRRDCKSCVLPVLALELTHERDKRVDAGLGERVVNRRAHAADRAMPLEAVEPGRGRLLDEPILEFLGRQAEGNVHPRTALLRRGSAVET